LLDAPILVHELAGLQPWAETVARQSFAGRMVAAGVLRLAGHCEKAGQLLRDERGLSDEELHTLRNERAALAWRQGNRETALADWKDMRTSAPSQFNLGMANLFTNPRESAPALQFAIQLLDDEDPWRHLAGIYLALAEMRS
jgi:hypothetical protein